MIEEFCEFLTNKVKTKMPDIDEEKEEIIFYGFLLIIGEIPKIILTFVIGAILGLWWQTLLAFFLILPYRISSGGFHLKTHLGCFLFTTIYYCGNAYISNIINFTNDVYKYLIIGLTLIFGLIMISIYAPADTENVPILSKKERKKKKILSYIFLTINLLLALCIPNRIISNLLLFETIFQTISITRLAYKITKNKYGYEEYLKAEQN